MSQHLPILSIIILFLSSLLILILGKKSRLAKNIIITIASILSLSMLLYLVKAVFLNKKIITYWLGGWEPLKEYAIGIGLEVDALSLFFGILVSALMLVAVIASFSHPRGNEYKLPGLMLIFSGSILGMIFTSDLLNLFIISQLAILSMAAMICIGNGEKTDFQRGLSFLTGEALGSVIIMLGIVLLYIQFRTLSIQQIAVMLHNNFTPVTLFAFAAMLGGFFVSAGIFPLHMNMADTMESSSLPGSIMLRGMLNVSGLYIIMRIVYMVYSSMDLMAMKYLFIICGSIMLIMLILLALRESNIKRSIIYQGISEIGLVILAFGLGTINGNSGGLYHILNQTIFITLLLLCIDLIEKKAGTNNIQRLGGLSRKLPFVFILFSLGAISLCGLPPFGGFVSKWIIFKNCFETNLWFLGVIIAVASVLATINIIRIIYRTFGGDLPSENVNCEKLKLNEYLPICLTTLMSLPLMLLPGYVIKYFISPAVAALYNIEGYVDAAMGIGYTEKWFGEQNILNTILPMDKGLHSPMAYLLSYLIIIIAIAVISIFSYYKKNRELTLEGDSLGDKVYGIISKAMDYVQRLNSGLLNEYSLVIVSTTAVLLVFMFIFV